MNTLRFNITVDREVGVILEKIKNKSHFITEAIREKLDREKNKRERESLKQAYKASTKEDLEIASDWEATSGDGL